MPVIPLQQRVWNYVKSNRYTIVARLLDLLCLYTAVIMSKAFDSLTPLGFYVAVTWSNVLYYTWRRDTDTQDRDTVIRKTAELETWARAIELLERSQMPTESKTRIAAEMRAEAFPWRH